MGLKTAFKRFFELEDELEESVIQQEFVDEQPDMREIVPKKETKKNNVLSLKSVQQMSKVILMEPKLFAEVQDIADQLKNHRSVVINLQRMSKDTAKRVIDFLSGTVYAIDGEIKKLGQETFLCVPDNVDITGVISEMMEEDIQ